MCIHQQLNFLFGWCVVILTIFQLNMFCNVEVLRFLLELQYTCSNNFFYLPLCVGDIETNIHFLLLCLRTVSILRTCGSLKVPRRILESDSLKILDALQNMVVEEGNIATLIMWNLWCTMNKFVFEETKIVTDSTIDSIFSQLYISQRAFGNSKFVGNMLTTIL